MRTKALEASTASIQTAQVAIQTVTVNRKQMTLSVFRQLPREGIWRLMPPSDLPVFQGEHWGRVNYFWKNGGGEELGGALHVLFVLNGVLCRALVQDIWTQNDSLRGDKAIRLFGQGFTTVFESNQGHYRRTLWDGKLSKLQKAQVKAWQIAFAKLNSLPQLFIAV